MGWSTEVHDSRVTTAIQQAKREARLRRAHKLPEPQGNAGGWPLAAVAGILLSAAALQRDRDWQRATSKFQQLLRQLPIQGTWSQKQRQQGKTSSSSSGTRSSQPSPRDKTATASSSGRVSPPAAPVQLQQTSSSQSQKKPKSKKKRGRRR